MSVASQHRIYLGRPHSGADPVPAHRHWRHRHSRVVRESMPHLAGYVQNRPMERYWGRLPYLACAETWFAGRDDERAAYASAAFRDVVAVDERHVITPDDAWNSSVERVEVVRPGQRGGFRVLGFGHAAPADADAAFARVETLRLRAATPGDGAALIASLWTADREAAIAAVGRFGGLAFVAEPAAVVAPPDEDWSALRTAYGTPDDPDAF